jgi:hypothetical protein
VEHPYLITVDGLRAAGSLDVPASWRRSLAVERDFLPGWFDDEDTHSEEEEPAPQGEGESALPQEPQ